MKERNPGQATSHRERCLEVVGSSHFLMTAWLELVSNFTRLKHKAAVL